MARKQNSEVVVKTPTKAYYVQEKFLGHINDKRFDCRVGDVIELTAFEHSVYKKYLREIV